MINYFGLLEMRLSVLDSLPRIICAFLGRKPKKNFQIAEKKSSFHSFENVHQIFKLLKKLFYPSKCAASALYFI